MKTIIRLLPFLALLPLVCALFTYGADPEPATTGHVLLLTNDRVLEGDIERVGEQYRIKRALGETWVEGGKVQRLCASLEDAYSVVRGRANLNDPDERLRLARWCHLYGLRKQAMEEVTEAAKLRPEHRETQRLLANLHQALSRPTPGAPTESPDVEPPAPLPALDLSAECMNHFATRVQPILMNACGNCHATGRGGAFKLTRPYDSQTVNRKTLQQNVAAVLAQVNLERPEGSPLLTKAVSAHAQMAQAPFRNRQAAPFRAIEDWVRYTIDSNPQLKETTGPSVGAPGQVAEPLKSVQSAVEEKPEKAEEAPAAETPARPRDAFDPLPFNRKMHPEKKN